MQMMITTKHSHRLLLFLAFFATSLWAQASENANKFSIKGSVTDAATNKPVPYANVLLYSHADSTFVNGTLSDSNGVYQFEKLPSGNYYLVFKFIGYKNQTLSHIAVAGSTLQRLLAPIKLQQTTSELDAVNISAEKTPVEFKIDKKVINVEQQINAISGTAVDVLQNSPGITVDANGNVFLRGSANYTVLMDGKPKPMAGADLLKQIPASSIKNIEIITNPSANYDAEGTSGIINIIMKKQTADGFNGLINASAGTWKKYTGDAQFNIKAKKFNFFVGGVARYQPYVTDEVHKQTNASTDTTYQLLGYGPQTQTVENYSGKGGIDFTPNTQNTFTLYAEYGRFGWHKAEDNKYAVVLPGMERYTLDRQRVDVIRDYLVSTFDYTHKFKTDAHKISVALQYTNREGKNKATASQYTSNANWDNLGANNLTRNQANSQAELYQVSIDYVNGFTDKRIFESGLQAKVRPIATTALSETFDNATQLWLFDTTYSNNYNFHNNNYAAYATYSDSFWGFDIKAGLRVEYTDRMLNQITKNKAFNFNQFDFFPSFYLSRSFKNNHQVQFSYSRRINHPPEWAINPFPFFNNNYAYGTGNPNLKPEYANAFELNYLKLFKIGSLSLCTFYRETQGGIDQVWKTDATGKTLITFENMNQNNTAGVELDANLSPTKWFSFNLGGSFYNYNVSGTISDKSFSNNSTNWDIRFTPNFKIYKTTRLQLNFSYTGPSTTTQGISTAYYGLNITLKQEFLKKRLAITINLQDILSTMQYKIVTKTPEYTSILSGDYQSPIVVINLTYKFNNFVRKSRPQEIMDVN